MAGYPMPRDANGQTQPFKQLRAAVNWSILSEGFRAPISFSSPRWSNEMEEFVADFLFDITVEIIPPETKDDRPDAPICLCCRRTSCWIDDDGCGICEECIAA